MSAEATKSLKQARIMLWGTPRCVSTAFARSMGARGDTEVFWEPYLACYSFGPEKTLTWGDHLPGMLNDKYTYSYIKNLLEQEYPDAKVLFVKGMVEGLRARKYDEILASGYKHSFLIRHPKKVFRSIERLVKETDTIDFKATFKDIYQDLDRLYEHVKSSLGQALPPIVDADDLVAQPDKILPKYCEAVGIEFIPKMLEWDSVDPIELNWHCCDVGDIANEELRKSVIFSNAMQSQGFGKKVAPPKEELSADVMECVAFAMPVYEKLHALRLKP